MATTVKVKSYLDVQEEYNAASALYPAHLVELTQNSKVQSHSSAGGNAEKAFALEDALQGNGMADEYSADDPVRVWFPQRGDQVNAILADGETVVTGNFLESAGDGSLQIYGVESSAAVTHTEHIVGVALEDVNTSGSSGVESAPSAGSGKSYIKIRIV